jgi:hypothetical protein
MALNTASANPRYLARHEFGAGLQFSILDADVRCLGDRHQRAVMSPQNHRILAVVGELPAIDRDCVAHSVDRIARNDEIDAPLTVRGRLGFGNECLAKLRLDLTSLRGIAKLLFREDFRHSLFS